MSDTTIRRKAQEVAELPHVASEIERHYTDLRSANMLTAERVLQEIGSIAFSDFTDFVEVDEIDEGKYQVGNLGDLTKEQRAAIKSIRPVQTPDGPESGDYRIIRGGDWRSKSGECRSAYRTGGAPDLRDGKMGFRLVR
jgi:hypothetical protein